MSFTIPIGQISSNPVVGATSVSEGPVGYRTTIPRLLSVSRPVSWVTVNSAGPPYDGDTAATTSPGRSRPGLAVTLEFPIQSATVFHKSTTAALALRFEPVDRRKLAACCLTSCSGPAIEATILGPTAQQGMTLSRPRRTAA